MVLVLVVDMLSSCMALACSSKQIVYLRYKSRERQKPRKRRLQSGGLKGKKKAPPAEFLLYSLSYLCQLNRRNTVSDFGSFALANPFQSSN